jgi:seryl-tRNA synthetase
LVIDRALNREKEEKGMGLLQRLKHDLKAGFATLRHGTAQAAVRALEETELLRIRLEIRKLDQQLDELYRDVGERAVILGEGGESAERVLYDTEVGRLVKEIQELKEARDKLESEVTEIRSDV